MIKKIIQILKKHKTFLISTHVGPDPDALCSEMALALFLKSIGKTVKIVNEEPLPARFSFLPRSNIIKGLGKTKVNYDVAIVLDCGELSRIGKVQSILDPDKILINIDHHITNKGFGDYSLVLPKASSTCEMLYDLLKQAKCKFTKDIALHLYAGIMTDTGSFRYDNTTANTHHIAGELLKYKFSASELYRNIYERMYLQDVEMFAKTISQFTTHLSGRVIFVDLKKRIISKFSEEFDLRETIFKYLRSIQGVEAIVIFTEVDAKTTRLNFRSSGKVDVAKIANAFDGGGHKKASGGIIYKSFKEARRDVLKVVKKQL